MSAGPEEIHPVFVVAKVRDDEAAGILDGSRELEGNVPGGPPATFRATRSTIGRRPYLASTTICGRTPEIRASRISFSVSRFPLLSS